MYENKTLIICYVYFDDHPLAEDHQVDVVDVDEEWISQTNIQKHFDVSRPGYLSLRVILSNSQ